MWETNKFIVLDGGTGRQIAKRGLPFRQPQWSALVLREQPEALIDIHSDFIKAGAEIITTNTYAIAPYHLTEEGYLKQGPQLIRLACEMAIKAKKNFPEKDPKIAFSIPPLFGSYRYDYFLANQWRAKEYYEMFLNSIKGLQEEIDFYLCETLSCIQEVKFYCKLLQKVNKPFGLSFSLDQQKEDLRHGTIKELGEFIKDLQIKPAAIMLNCSNPEIISKGLPKLVAAIPKEIKIGCYANTFVFEKKHEANSTLNHLREDINIKKYQEFAEEWGRMGARIIGGCCGIGPEYLPGIVEAIKKISSQQK